MILMAAWSDEEIQFLKDNSKEMEYKDIAVLLGRNEASVVQKVIGLGLNKNMNWNNVDVSNDIDTVVEELKSTRSKVMSARRKKGIFVYDKEGENDEEIEILYIKNCSIAMISRSLGIPAHIVRYRLKKMKLR